MAVTYFGNTDDYSGSIALNSVVWYNTAQAFACPGTGTFDVVELAVQTYGGTENVRLAIYLLEGDDYPLVAQGSAKMALAGVEGTWVTHTAFKDSSGNVISPTLTGGKNYSVAVTGGNAATWIARSVSIGSCLWDNEVSCNYLDTGFPATLPSSGMNTGNSIPCVRIGITEHVDSTRPKGVRALKFVIGFIRGLIDWIRGLFGAWCFT